MDEAEIQTLIDRAKTGDAAAREELLAGHRARLRRMVSARLDRRIAGRFDGSDVVQEALAEAWKRFDEYLMDQKIPFYPWLRGLAWSRLVKLHRAHVVAEKRTVLKESALPLPQDSSVALAHQLAATGPTPSGEAIRKEVVDRARVVLTELPDDDQELLSLIYLEQLVLREVAAVLDTTEAAVKMRHLRALRRLRKGLEE